MEELHYKVVFLGDHGVGKTSLLTRYDDEPFNEYEKSTVTATFKSKTLEYEGKNYIFDLLDTPGTEAFRSLTKIYMKNSHIIILVYDVTKKRSFLELQFWLDYILETYGQKMFLILIGNKSDLTGNINIKESDGAKFAKIIKAPFIQLSAKDNDIELKKFLDDTFKYFLKKVHKDKVDIEEDIDNKSDSFEFS